MQEEGNIPYVIDNGVGAFEKQPSKIADIVVDWLGEGEVAFKDMARKAKALGRPEVRFGVAKVGVAEYQGLGYSDQAEVDSNSSLLTAVM